MPSARSAAEPKSSALPAARPHNKPFNFPESHHLLITTPQRILTWDRDGIRTVFTNCKDGIVVAREAKDGSGIFAVASEHVVVLHDIKRRQETIWGLNASEGALRHLEYSNDARSLYMSTNQTHAIQRYSTTKARLFDLPLVHSSELVDMALSPTGHLILSLSSSPPTIRLTHLTGGRAASSVDLRGSLAAATLAAFHPDRPNVFLLAFKDGSLAAYNARRLPKDVTSRAGVRVDVEDIEIGRLSNLHKSRSWNGGSKDQTSATSSVVGAAFLPGFKTRAIAVASNGSCKLVDFAKGGIILRTWHVQSPLTAVSVLRLDPPDSKGMAEVINQPSTQSRSGHQANNGEPNASCLIAVSRDDGNVNIYNAAGIILTGKTIYRHREGILNIEWMKGKSPTPLDSAIEQIDDVDRAANMSPETVETAMVKTDPRSEIDHIPDVPSLPHLSSQTSHSVNDFSADSRSSQLIPSAVDSNEMPVSTVKYRPASKDTAPHELIALNERYEDLFSPVRPTFRPVQSPRKGVPSNLKASRQRISSRTFLKSPAAQSVGEGTVTAAPRNVALFPSDSHASSATSHSKCDLAITSGPPKSTQSLRRNLSPLKGTRQYISYRASSTYQASPSRMRESPANRTRQILAGLRSMNQTNPSNRQPGTLSVYAPSQHRNSQPFIPSSATLSSLPSNSWPTDSMPASLPTPSSAEEQSDIWLTSDSEHEVKRRFLHHRARHESNGPAPAFSFPHQSSPVDSMAAKLQTGTYDSSFDSSSENVIAHPITQQDPSEAESVPLSDKLRMSHPRTVHLSSQKSRQLETQEEPSSLEAVTAENRGDVDSKNRQVQAKRGDVVERPCSCKEDGARTAMKVRELENEVMRLRGEVLALKAVVRRNGLPMPGCLR